MSVNSQILSASCNKCGTGLELPPGLRFATCQFCGSRLEVRFTGGVVFTDVLDASNDGDRQIAHDLQLIKLQNELNRLDQEWNFEREKYRILGRHGGSTLPSEGNTAFTVLGGLGAGIFGIFWTATAASRGAPDFFPAFGVIFTGAAVVMVLYACARHGQYTTAVGQYQERRHRLLNAINQLEVHPTASQVVLESVSP